MNARFLPEGRLLYTPENQKACATRRALLQAMGAGRILEGRVLLCGTDHSLIVRVGEFTGSIPREEAALGIAEGTTRDIAILSRVGKPICFTVEAVEGPEGSPSLLLSRRRAQTMALQNILATWKPGLIVPATVTHLEPFGAFVDIGCGIPSMIGIENLSVSRIPHPGCRLAPGQKIFALVTGVDRDLNRVNLSHKELLGTWAENAACLSPGMTVPGYVRGVKDYGVFIELFPNLSGLAEPKEGLQEGDRVSVYIKSILPERRKIKLRVLERLPREETPPPLPYFHREGMLEDWQYAP
ncbi:MAG: S1 RNA-binding domain-containing protein [Oscillospiraceae bacterium]